MILRAEAVIKPEKFENGTKPHDDWLPIASPYYNYFAFIRNRPAIITIIQNEKFKEEILPLEREIIKVGHLGHNVSALSENISSRTKKMLFVARRNCAAHFTYTRLILFEEQQILYRRNMKSFRDYKEGH